MITKNSYHMIQRMLMSAAAVVILSTAAYADTDVGSARIVKLGIDPRFGPMVQLVDTGVSPKWVGVRQFYLSEQLGNAGLATLLTAFSLDEKVWVRIADTAEPGSLVKIIYVNAPAP